MGAPDYRRPRMQRRALLGLLPDATSSTDTATTTARGGLVGGLTSAVGDVTSAVGGVVSNLVPSTTSSLSSSTTSSSSSTSAASSSSTSSLTTSSSTTSSITSSSRSSSSSTTSSAVSTSASSTAVPESTPQPVSQDETTTYVSTSDGQGITITQTIPVSNIVSPTATTGTGSHQSFLQNKPLSGIVFAIVALIGLAILVLISTWTVRHARKKKLERQAETFEGAWPDPAGYGATGEKLTRTPSGRTAHSNAGSDEALVGGYGSQKHFNDGPPPHMQQYNAPSTRGQPPPMAGYGYENPYAAYQQPAYMPPSQQASIQRAPTNGSAWSGTTYGQHPPPGPMPPMQPLQMQGQAQQYPSPTRSPNNSPPPTSQGALTVIDPGPGSGLKSGAPIEAAVRESTGSDAYADYAYSTGPGQQAGPRNLTVANA